MKQILLTILISCAFIKANAQTGIGTTTPNSSAKLEVYATNKGFLPPRVTLTSATDASTIAAPAEGLLVYNLGSVGLQSGYYYWNGASWATIATATSAGNGVTATNMVKLYSEAHSSAAGKISNTSGYVFTVPVSGRYLFDFTSSGTAINGGTATFYFQVRQGTTALGSDMQSSYNNNVHVEYNGKVEVNLQAGVSYNVYNYTTSGSFETNDYDRVYYKLVSGNLPVTGQSVDYIQASLSSNQGLSAAGNIIFNASSGAGITLTGGGFNLIANKTYKLEAALGGSSTGYGYYAWVDNSNTILAGGSIGVIMKAGTVYSDAPQDKAVVYYTPTSNSTVYLRVLNISGTLTAFAPPVANNYSSTWATIQQVGSSAFVNPWTLSGTNTYNTTGNVGVGNNTPSQALDVTGTGKFSGGIINNGSRTYLGKDGANMHWIATTDAVGESNNLAYGFESNGSSIQAHRWLIGGAEKMKLNSSGYLGIGITSPGRKLHIQTADASSVYVESTTSDNNGLMTLNANTNQNWASNWHEFLLFQNQGNTIGHITGGSSGNAVTYNTTSDYRLKMDLKNYNALELLKRIKTYDFAWKKDSSRMYGVMAHELQSVLPYMVTGKKDAVEANGKIIPQAVDYSKLTPILVKAIQEQDVKIMEQEIKMLKLNKDKEALEQRVNNLELLIKEVCKKSTKLDAE